MGREFVNIFDEWVDFYDDSVAGKDEEYREVFRDYNEILQTVAGLAAGATLEFGVGTGNLTKELMLRGIQVYGIEPNDAMRKVARSRLPSVPIADGDFLEFKTEGPVQTIVSTYAFHHLTDKEKLAAIEMYRILLPEGGQIVFADTVFADEEARRLRMEQVRQQGFLQLLADLEREHYTTIPLLQEMLLQNGFSADFRQLNDYVWLIHAIKKPEKELDEREKTER